jgi:hypothetical protein
MKITGEAHWHTLVRARAIETGCFVLAPAQCGEPHAGRASYGHSLVVNPWGEVIAEAGTEPATIIADLDLAQVPRRAGGFPASRRTTTSRWRRSDGARSSRHHALLRQPDRDLLGKAACAGSREGALAPEWRPGTCRATTCSRRTSSSCDTAGRCTRTTSWAAATPTSPTMRRCGPCRATWASSKRSRGTSASRATACWGTHGAPGWEASSRCATNRRSRST